MTEPAPGPGPGHRPAAAPARAARRAPATSTSRPRSAGLPRQPAARAARAWRGRILGVLVLTVGSLPLLFRLFPDLAEVDVARAAAAWLLLGVARLPVAGAARPAVRAPGRAQRARLRAAARRSSTTSDRAVTTDGVPGLVALVVVSLATLAIGTYGLRFSRTTSDFYVASRIGPARAQRLGDRRRVPLGRVVPRRRRAGAHLRRADALVPGRLDRRLPRAAGAGRRAAAPQRRLHAARLRRGAARLAPGPRALLGAGRGDRLALPAAAVPGRRAHAAPPRSTRRVGRRGSSSARSSWST